MNTSKWFFAILFLLLAHPVSAQIIGDESLRKIEQGEVSFLEGEFIAFLDDTVSPDFIQSEFSRLKYFLTYIDIEPILITIVNSPDDSTLYRLRSHPNVTSVYSDQVRIDTTSFENMLSVQGLTGEEYDKALARLLEFESRPTVLYEFDYSVDEARLKEIMAGFRNVAYDIFRNPPRSVNIQCEPGTEQDAMTKVEELPFVQSTALIGIVDY
ncbi:MAG: hypothetical protein ED557_10295 [Balneola sp.]|nr:MAG: hypothetical protein ED557_10295 [Balneola sp.]